MRHATATARTTAARITLSPRLPLHRNTAPVRSATGAHARWSVAQRLNRFAIVVTGVFVLAACDSGAPPRHQADTLSLSTGPARSSLTADTALAEIPIPSSAQPTGTAAVRTRVVPLAQHSTWGDTPGPIPVGAASSVGSAAPAFDLGRACRTGADCALVPDDCTKCPPCEATWRQAANRSTVDQIVESRRAVECPPIACMQCRAIPRPGHPPRRGGYIGTSVDCIAGQCVSKDP